MFRKKEQQLEEVQIDLTDVLNGIRNAKIWMIFNAVLFFGGMAASLVFPLIAIGVLIFCPISIIKNFRKYLKFKKYLKNYTNEFPEEFTTEKDESIDETVQAQQASASEGKSRKQQLEEYEQDYLQKIEPERIAQEQLPSEEIIEKDSENEPIENPKDSSAKFMHTALTDKQELSEIEKILFRLDEDEKVLCVARQSRIKPGGSKITTPNIIFATDRRLIIRNPSMLGMRENIEDYSYDKITKIKLEKGVFSSTIVITSPGMGTEARTGRSTGLIAWGRGEDGMIDAIPKEKAEQIIEIIRERMERAKKLGGSSGAAQSTSMADELAKYVKLKEQGVLTEEEFISLKKDLLDKILSAKGEKVKVLD